MKQGISLAPYQAAYALWRQGDLAGARDRLRKAWRATGARTIYGMLLMAYILRDMKQPVSEIAQLQELLETFGTAPETKLLADAWSLLGSARRMLGENRAAVDALLQSAALEPDPVQKLVECSNAIFAANSVEGYTADAFQTLYARYRDLLAAMMAACGAQPYPRPSWHHTKLRIGYLSADLRDHAVAQFVRPLLVGYDHAAFDVYVYSLTEREDAVTAVLQDPAAVWRRVADWPFDKIAAQIRADEIDVLFDLSGHSARNALPVFAWRAAKVQIAGIGYFNSTGLAPDVCDGFLSDVHCAPEERSPFFTEKLLRLPETHFCYAPFTRFPPVAPPPCRAKGFVTFGCFNNFSKVTDIMLGLWRQILAAVPDAHLLLKHSLLGMDEGRDDTLKRLRRLGWPDDMIARVEFRGLSKDYLAQYGDMDIALDTAPYPGGLTTCEALMMGVPVVTLAPAGARHGARFGKSFLANIGMAELAAETPERYVALAVGLASDHDLLATLREILRPKLLASPLMDEARYVQNVEALFHRLVRDADEKNAARS